MKILALLALPVISMMPAGNPIVPGNSSPITPEEKVLTLNFQDKQEPGQMRSVVFKNQEYCRAELENFEFEGIQFTVVSATVYFSGANFRGVERGYINSNKLKPVKALMDRCIPGSLVVFDDVK